MDRQIMIEAKPVARDLDIPEIIYRQATISDLPLILSDWTNSYRDSPLTRHVPASLYFPNHKALIARLMQRGQTIVICNPNNTDQVYGWCCYQPHPDALIVHYIYIKEALRALGFAKQLLSTLTPPDASSIICTHTGKCFRALKDKYHLIYNPYLLGAT